MLVLIGKDSCHLSLHSNGSKVAISSSSNLSANVTRDRCNLVTSVHVCDEVVVKVDALDESDIGGENDSTTDIHNANMHTTTMSIEWIIY